MGIPTVRVKLLAYAMGAAMGGMAGAFLGVLHQHGQRRPVRVLVLDLRARDDHPRRPRVDLGRGASGALALSFINTRLIPDVLNNVPVEDRARLRPDPARLRHLRLPAGDHDGPATAGPDPGAATPGRAHRGAGRRRARVARRRSHERGGERGRGHRPRHGAGDPRDAGPDEEFGGLAAVDSVSFGCPRRRSRRSSGPTAPARRRSSTCSPGSTGRASGNVIFDGKDVTARRPDQITALGVARTFQNIRLFGTMSAVENVIVGQHARLKAARVRRDHPPAVGAQGGEGGGGKARELLDYVGRAQAAPRRRRDEPVLRRPAPGGDRPRAGLGPEAAAAGRADGRHEPAGVRAADAVHAQAARRARGSRSC